MGTNQQWKDTLCYYAFIWTFAAISTVFGAYNHVRDVTKLSCRTDHPLSISACHATWFLSSIFSIHTIPKITKFQIIEKETRRDKNTGIFHMKIFCLEFQVIISLDYGNFWRNNPEVQSLC
jgi:hypothetical protein